MNTINNFLNEISSKYTMKTVFKYFKEGEILEKTYMGFESDTNCFASYLLNIYGINNKMAIISPTSYEWIVTYFAVTKSQNCIVTLDYSLNEEELSKMINFSDVTVLFISEKYKQYISFYKEKCPNLKDIFILETDIEDFLLIDYKIENNFNENTLAQIIFTSGTSGKNKAVMLSHKNLTSLYYYGVENLNSSIVSLSILPLHHVAELINGIFYTLINGGTICINDELQNLMKNLQIFKPSVMTVVPLIMNKFAMAALEALKKANLSDEYLNSLTLLEKRKMFNEFNKKIFGGNLFALMVGGAAMDSEKASILEKVGIRVTQGYGLSESTAVVTANKYHFNDLTTCGVVFIKGTEIKTENNEILIKGPNIMLGYYKDIEATKNAFTKDGFFKTGDLGIIRNDGHLKITGRKKNLIILDNGENISPEEIEMLIAKNLYATMNIVYSDNNKLCCAVYSENITDVQKNDVLNAISEINSNMPMYKKIVKVDFVSKPFILTTKNSIKRDETIKNILIETNTTKIILKPENEKENKIYQKIKELLKIEEFSIMDNIFELGMDSLSAIELATFLNIDVQDIYNNKTVRKIANITDKAKNIETDREANKLVQINKNLRYENTKDNYFITGASGFFGCYILNELEKQGKRIYCLVRDKQKLLDTYKTYFNKELSENVEIFIGDICYDNFALSTYDFSYLKKNVKHVIHSAAIVKHVGDETTFMEVNVEGTKKAINFAKECNAVFHYISSYSVSGFGLTKQNIKNIKFDENILNIKQDYKQNIYVHTKYLAEKEVLKAKKDGLLTNIYRVGSLTWDKNGNFQVNEEENGLYNRLLGLIKSKKYCIDEKDTLIDLTPIDECCKAFVNLMQMDYANNIYHLFNPNVLGISDFEKIYNLKFNEVDKSYFKKLSNETDDKNIKVYADYEKLIYPINGNIIDCKQTLEKLHKSGFKWSEIDEKYLKLKIG